MDQMNRSRTHSYGYSTETVRDGFRLEQTNGQESCGTVTVAAENTDEGGDTGDGTNGGDGGDGGDDGDDGGTGGGGGENASSRVPESVPVIGGRKYTDPTVLATLGGAGLVGFTALSGD